MTFDGTGSKSPFVFINYDKISDVILWLDKNYYLPLASEKPIGKNNALLNTIDTIDLDASITFTRPFYNTRDLRMTPQAPIYNQLLGNNLEISVNTYIYLIMI